MIGAEVAARLLQQALSVGTGCTACKDPDDVSSHVQARSDGVGGRGVYATQALTEGTEILRISHSALVTAAVGQDYAEGQALKQLADDVDNGGEWPPGVAIKALAGENSPEFPNEETYIVLALVLEDAMRIQSTRGSDPSIVAALANDGRHLHSNLTVESLRRQMYYATLPSVEELRKFHPLFMVPDLDPVPEPEHPQLAQVAVQKSSPPVPHAVRAAVGRALRCTSTAVDAGVAAEAAAKEYWSSILLMHQAIISEYHSLCAILGANFSSSHSAEEWLYCWTMVMSRNFLLQIGDASLGGAFVSSIAQY